MLLTQKYQCPACQDVYESEYMAERCCPVQMVYVCGKCKKTFGDYDKEEAEACCVTVAGSPVVRSAQCHLCNSGPLTADDIRDSAILGTVPRCRPCILSVAPEMQTAEAIAYGRAA